MKANVEHTSLILAQIHAGLRTDWTQIHSADTSLQLLCRSARALGVRTLQGAHRQQWDRVWDRIDAALEAMHRSAWDAQAQLEGSADGSAHESAQRLVTSDEAGEADLHTLNALARESLPGDESRLWTDLWPTLLASFQAVRGQVRAIHFKLDLIGKYGAEEAAELTDQLLRDWAREEDPEAMAARYQQALEGLRHDHHVGGVTNIFKALLMMPEETVPEKKEEIPA